MNLWLFPGMSVPTDVEVTSDAAGSLGFGAYYNSEWFNGAWVPSQADQFIAYKELFPVVVPSHVWGPQWLRCDNEAVVHILIARTSRVPCIMCLLCHLFSAAARFTSLNSLHSILSLVFIMILLMLFHAFAGRNSGGWHPWHSFTRFQSFLKSGSS